MPPYPVCPGPFFTFYAFTPTFSTFTYAFFINLRRWMPSGWMPGAVAPPPPHPPLHATYLTAILCFFCSGMFSFYAQQNIHEASTIVEFIENAMRHSQEGKCLYYLRPRSPSAAPAPVQLLYPVSRFLGVFSLKHLAQAAVLSHLRRPDLIDRLPLSTVEKESLRRQQHTRRQRAGP